ARLNERPVARNLPKTRDSPVPLRDGRHGNRQRGTRPFCSFHPESTQCWMRTDFCEGTRVKLVPRSSALITAATGTLLIVATAAVPVTAAAPDAGAAR